MLWEILWLGGLAALDLVVQGMLVVEVLRPGGRVDSINRLM